MRVALQSSEAPFHPYIKWPTPSELHPRVSKQWSVSDLCKAYRFPTKLKGGGVIGILELGGSWVQSDLDRFCEINKMPSIQVENVIVSGNGPDTPGADSSSDAEVALDIEVAAAAYFYATGKIPAIKVFWAANTFGSFAEVIEKAAHEGCDVLSISWGSNEDAWESKKGLAQAVEAAAEQATAKGMIVFAAAGDNSSNDGTSGANVDLPSACPHVVGCGGTTKTKTTEVVWGNGRPDGSGTGGGYSDIFPHQNWQVGAPARTPTDLGGRLVPDVAANADPNTGYMIVVGGQEVQVGGTSAVAPFYAGLFAAVGIKVGYVTPTLWKNPDAFVDITEGSNGSYEAMQGPDPCTGLGVPIGTAIAALFAGGGGVGKNVVNIKRADAKPQTASSHGASICSVYAILKPILQAIALIPFFPGSWKSAIKAFLAAMDELCGSKDADSSAISATSLDEQLAALSDQTNAALASYFQPAGVSVKAIDLHDFASRICPVYKTLRPILEAAKGFVPGPWKLGIELAEELLDSLCGVNPMAMSAHVCGCK